MWAYGRHSYPNHDKQQVLFIKPGPANVFSPLDKYNLKGQMIETLKELLAWRALQFIFAHFSVDSWIGTLLGIYTQNESTGKWSLPILHL